jgi:hypothetical protein
MRLVRFGEVQTGRLKEIAVSGLGSADRRWSA